MSSVLGTNLLAEVAGLITDLFEKLAGPDGTTWLFAFKKFLRKENSWGTREWTIWKTIRLGTGLRTAGDFRQTLMTVGIRIGEWANNILGQPAFKASETEEEVNLVVVSVSELGFKSGGATRKDIYARAQALGLTLCPAEVGPQLRLQYQDQPKGEWLYIAMEPIAGSGGSLSVFSVGHSGSGRWLDSGHGSPDYFWDGDDRFVFVLRK